MKHWLKHHWRDTLARLPLPTLALAASWGVGSFAALFVPVWIAVIQAAAFELTYIGLAIVEVPEAARRKRAAMISLAAVAVSVVYNSAAGYFHRNPGALLGLSFGEELGLAIAHGAPLAIVAYLVADLLLHTAPRDRGPRWRVRRALIRRLLDRLRRSRDQLAQTQSQLAQQATLVAQLQTAAAQPDPVVAQQEQEIAQLTGKCAQWQQAVAQQAREHTAELRKKEQEIARLTELAAQPIAIDGIDLMAVARRLRSSGVSSRDTADLLRMKESTLRARLDKAAQNGHEVPV